MPVGVNVEDDPINPGFVLVEFVDANLRGPALASLIADGGPDIVEPLTREKGSERKRYRVPSGNASAAGLIDGSGTELDDITQTGPADTTGMVLPTAPTSANAFGPVIRKGTYKNGYGDNVQIPQPGKAVGRPPAAPTQAEVAEYVNTNQASLKEREGRDANDNGTLGLASVSPFAQDAPPLDTGNDDEPPADLSGDQGYPTDSAPSMDWTRDQLNAYAKTVKGVDTSNKAEYPAKADVLNVINAPA